MERKNWLTRCLVLILSVVMAVGMVVPTWAASIKDATIHMDKMCSLTLYKFDWTNAAKDGVWWADSYVSTGQFDSNVNTILGTTVRKGDDDPSSILGNGESSNGYALKGVEYTYLKVADIVQFSESAEDGQTASHVEVLYKMNKSAAADLLKAIGLSDGLESYNNANALDSTSWYYQSDVLIHALRKSLASNPTTTKNALEAYVTTKGGTAMPLTDVNGKTEAKNLAVGLYLLVETKVPEMVTSTTNPFFVSLPMTSVDGGGNGSAGNGFSVTTGGHDWLYDVTVYPKNETGIVTLEKTVREAKEDTATHGGSLTDITDGYAHTATASNGDTVEYQIISTLPTITSTATNIAEYTFRDILARGLSYTSEVKIEIYKDTACTPENRVATWTEAHGKFVVSKVENGDQSHSMTIEMTAAGLAEINTANTAEINENDKGNGADGEHLYTGYSNYTLRITYAATVNSDESMVYGDAGNCNEVVLTWRRSSSSYYDTLIDDAHVFTYGINLTKTFSDGKNEQELFNNVLFKIFNKTDNYYVEAQLNETEGIWYVTDHMLTEEEGTSFYPVDWQGQKGQIVVKGLENDEYVLTEIETANGYTLLKENIVVEIMAADDAARPCDVYEGDILGVVQNDSRYNFDGGMELKLANIPQAALAHNLLSASACVDGNAVTMIKDEVDTASPNAMAPLTVVNTHGFDLPQTGELGAFLLPIVGCSMIGVSMISFFILLISSHKKKKRGA